MALALALVRAATTRATMRLAPARRAALRLSALHSR